MLGDYIKTLYCSFFMLFVIAIMILPFFVSSQRNGSGNQTRNPGQIIGWLCFGFFLMTPMMILWGPSDNIFMFPESDLHRLCLVQGFYLAIALVWIAKLQIQISNYKNQGK